MTELLEVPAPVIVGLLSQGTKPPEGLAAGVKEVGEVGVEVMGAGAVEVRGKAVGVELAD